MTLPTQFQYGGYPAGGFKQRDPGMGRVCYVSSLYGLDSNDGSIEHPFKTFDKAYTTINNQGQFYNSQNRGDTIILMPGHVDTSTFLSTNATYTIARNNLTVYGWGVAPGQVNQCAPTFNFTGGTSNGFTITGSNVTFENLYITTSTAATVSFFTIGSTCATLRNIMFNGVGSGTYVHVVQPSATTSNLIDGLTVDYCRNLGESTANAGIINITGSMALLTVTNNILVAGINSTNAVIQFASAKNCAYGHISRNYLRLLGTASSTAYLINLPGTNSGTINDNRGRTGQSLVNVVSAMAGTGVTYNQNYVAGADSVSGVLVPAAQAS